MLGHVKSPHYDPESDRIFPVISNSHRLEPSLQLYLRLLQRRLLSPSCRGEEGGHLITLLHWIRNWPKFVAGRSSKIVFNFKSSSGVATHAQNHDLGTFSKGCKQRLRNCTMHRGLFDGRRERFGHGGRAGDIGGIFGHAGDFGPIIAPIGMRGADQSYLTDQTVQ
jgi:hypothetical protein